MKELIRNEIIHLLVSVFFALIFFPVLGLFQGLAVSLLFGFFVDLDHLFDYGFYLKRKESKFSISQFIAGSYFTKCPFLTPLHSWELCLIIFIIYLSTPNPYILLACLALTTHLFIDQLTNNIVPLHWFLIYRLYLRKKEVQYK